MLQKLNERIQGVVAWVVIILVAITFTLFGIDYYIQSRHETSLQIEVNGKPITKQAFEVNYRRIRQTRDPSLMTAALEAQLRQQVMDEMVMNAVSVQAATQAGFAVNPTQANAAILSIPQFQQDGQFSTDKYQQAISGALYTPETFQKEVRQGMLLNQQRFTFIGTSFALPNEIKQFVKLYMQKRDYNYLQINAAQFVKGVTVTSEEIKDYYKTHQKEFMTPEKISIDFIHLTMSDIKKKINITDRQVKKYYNENNSNFYAPAQWKVAHILFAVPADATILEKERVKKRAEEAYATLEKDPAQFDNLVKTISDDKISAMKSGALPWIVAGQSKFDKTFVNLKNSGDISEPVLSEHGFEIFKLLASKESKIKPLSDVKQDIQEQLLIDMAQTEYAQALEKLSDLTYQTPDSLKPVAKALKLNIEESELFSRKGGNTDLTKSKLVINAAFSHDVLTLGNNSETVQLNNDGVVVVRVNKHIPAAQTSLEEIKSIIEKNIALDKARTEAKRLGEELTSSMNDVTKYNELLTTNKLVWHPIVDAARDTDLTQVAINDLAFNIASTGSEKGLSLENGDYVIVNLKKINDDNLDLLDKEQVASITQQIESSYGMMDYDLYISGLMNKATIVKH